MQGGQDDVYAGLGWALCEGPGRGRGRGKAPLTRQLYHPNGQDERLPVDRGQRLPEAQNRPRPPGDRSPVKDSESGRQLRSRI